MRRTGEGVPRSLRTADGTGRMRRMERVGLSRGVETSADDFRDVSAMGEGSLRES